jgi:LysM repeat protein
MFCSDDKKSIPGASPYSIQRDDTFYKISKYYSINLDDLLEANPYTDPDKLIVGDILCIPLSLQNVHCHLGSETYTIQENDTIYTLAQRFNIKIDALLKANSRISPDALLPGQIICIPKPWNKYSNENYKISFMYPTRWAKINNLHYEGVDGFFRISALKTDLKLEDICKAEAFHKLKPYGANPDIVPTMVAGYFACLVIPSTDQPMEMKNQAALIIQYTQELEINNQYYNHLVIWADKEHITDIENSLIILD